ncbi:hypothetical protein ACQKMN_06100 [Ureibacillus composti]
MLANGVGNRSDFLTPFFLFQWIGLLLLISNHQLAADALLDNWKIARMSVNYYV